MRSIIAVILIVISFFVFGVYLAGSHGGHLAFRPWMTEDWVFWSLMIIPASTGIFILFRQLFKVIKKTA